MPFQIIRNDITKVKADIVVNSANPEPVIGDGTDSAVYAAAGSEKLLARRRKIGSIAPGQAAETPAYRLPAKHIIHTVGPVWVDGKHGERDILRSCYANSLSLAADLRAKSIAFPMIATGVYGFPKDEALNIALSEIGKFLLTHDMQVILVVFDRNTFELSARLVGEIDEFIDDHGVHLAREAEYSSPLFMQDRRRSDARRQLEWADLDWKNSTLSDFEPLGGAVSPQEPGKTDAPGPRKWPGLDRKSKPLFEDLPLGSASPDESSEWFPAAAPCPAPSMAEPSLEDLLKHTGETFQQRLLRLIDQSGMTDAAVYKKANIDRRVFSRIRSKKDYKPKKVTAVAFAIALQLDLDTMTDLLSRAEIAFSPSNRFDLIITYFVTHRNYDIFEINAALFKYGQPILGE